MLLVAQGPTSDEQLHLLVAGLILGQAGGLTGAHLGGAGRLLNKCNDRMPKTNKEKDRRVSKQMFI